MSKQSAQQEALQIAIDKLKTINLSERCPQLGLPVPEDGTLRLRAFGKNMLLDVSDFSFADADSPKPIKLGDQVLVLHYLLCETSVAPADKLISFRGYPEGQFYWQPFQSRTVNPLLGRIGNDLDLLRNHLERFDWEPVDMGDLGARIHVIGPLFLTLVYHLGDDEFPPSADVLFDACITQVFVAEDVAVLASRICLGLL
jgi:hypothetical protein